MKTRNPSLAACVVVLAACLAWVGGITFAMVYFLGLSTAVGWTIAGSLGFSSTVAVTIILYEMRHAMDIAELLEPVDGEESMRGIHWGAGADGIPRKDGQALAFSLPREVY